MQTFYIVKENGYREPVRGQVVLVHGSFRLFCHIDNGRYVIRDRKTSFLFGEAETLVKAKQNSLDYIHSVGQKDIENYLIRLQQLQGPGRGK